MAEDKVKHFFACAGIAFLTSTISYLLGAPQLCRTITGAISGIFAGLAKEYADKQHGSKFDWMDVVVDVAGSACGSLLMLACTYGTILPPL